MKDHVFVLSYFFELCYILKLNSRFCLVKSFVIYIYIFGLEFTTEFTEVHQLLLSDINNRYAHLCFFINLIDMFHLLIDQNHVIELVIMWLVFSSNFIDQ